MYSHFLEPKAFDSNLLFVDVEEAKRFIHNPDIWTTCLDTAQSTCTEQYVYSTVFGIIGGYLLITGVLRILANHGLCGLQQGEYFSIITTTFTNTSLSSERKHSTVSPEGLNSKEHKKKLGDFQPGGKLFWVTCIITFCMDLIFQILRCFTVTGSYATTNAAQTLAQIFVMIVQVDASLYMYYTQSHFGFVIVRFCADIVYFIVRFSAGGSLVMHSEDCVDFLTMAVPLILCVKDIDSMTKFIRLSQSAKKSNSEGLPNSFLESINIHRGIVAIFFGLVATIVGVIGVVEIFNRKGECSSDTILLPDGFECMDWQFNLYLDPSCSCSYLHINVPECEESKAGFQEDFFTSQETLNGSSSQTEPQSTPSFDHIKDSQLLVINYAPGCIAMNSDHSEYFSGFKDLQMVSLQAATFEEFPSDLSDFPNLMAVYLHAPNLEHIESKTLDAWPKLQVLHCSPCPSLDSEELFTNVDLPRLQSVKLEGVSSCSDENKFGLKNQLNDYECTNRNDTVCGNMPKWILQHHVNRVRRTTHTKCNEPSCEFFLDVFSAFDSTYQGASQADALFNAFEFGRYLQFLGFPGVEDISDDSYACMFETLREQVQFDQTVYQGSDPSDGMTLLEFLASQSAHSNCAQCASTQGKITVGAENFANQQKILVAYPYQCKDANVPVVKQEKFRQACNPPKRSCDTQCGFLIPVFTKFGWGVEYTLTEQGFIDSVARYAPIGEGVFQCFGALGGSSCVDTSEGWENLKIPLERLIPMWVFMMNWFPDKEPTSCQDCWNVASDVENCWDNDYFIDVQGDSCNDWVGYDCWEYYLTSEVLQDRSWLYSRDDVAHIIFNCPLSCGICEQFGDPAYCWDTLQFRDARGNSCETWIGRDCFDQEAAETLGYSADELAEVQENCMFSCGQCIPETASPTTVPTTTPQPTMVNALPKQCEGLDWLPPANFIEAFNTTTTTCTPACSKIMGHILPWDADEDGYFTNAEIVEFKEFYGQDVSDLFPVVTCVDNQNFKDRFQYSQIYNLSKYLKIKNQNGFTCSVWQQNDCFDDYLNTEFWHYDLEDMEEIQHNCPLSCGICISEEPVEESICQDDPQFTDAYAYPCSAWLGYDCTDFERMLRWGYSAANTRDIIQNCPSSCGLCDELKGPRGLLACWDALVPGIVVTDESGFTPIQKIPKENYFSIHLGEFSHEPSLCSQCDMCLTMQECEADNITRS